MATGTSDIRRAAGWLLPVALFGLSILCERARPVAVQGSVRTVSNDVHLVSAISRRPSLAFGFQAVLADLMWLKAVQAAAPIRMTEADYARLEPLLDIVVRLDPRFMVPYLVGGISLGESPRHAGEALRLLALGHRNFPDEWQMLFYSAYIRYFTLGDPVGGGRALLEAARNPKSPKHFPLLAARMLAEGKEPRTALAFLAEMLEREKDPGRRAVLERRIAEVALERDLLALDGAIAAYRDSRGRMPGSLADLVQAGILSRIPEEPFGGTYRIGPGGAAMSDSGIPRLKVFSK